MKNKIKLKLRRNVTYEGGGWLEYHEMRPKDIETILGFLNYLEFMGVTAFQFPSMVEDTPQKRKAQLYAPYFRKSIGWYMWEDNYQYALAYNKLWEEDANNI